MNYFHFQNTSQISLKIGTRVQWPADDGYLFPFLVEMDLLSIGDDVIIGKDTLLYLTTAKRSARISIHDGVHIGEHCVILPGAVLCRGTTVHVATIVPENAHFLEGSIYVGNKDGLALAIRLRDSSMMKFNNHQSAMTLDSANTNNISDDNTDRDSNTAYPYGSNDNLQGLTHARGRGPSPASAAPNSNRDRDDPANHSVILPEGFMQGDLESIGSDSMGSRHSAQINGDVNAKSKVIGGLDIRRLHKHKEKHGEGKEFGLITPYGKAVYQRQAAYYVLPSWVMAIASFLAEGIGACYINSSCLLAFYFVTQIIIPYTNPVGRQDTLSDYLEVRIVFLLQ